MPSLKPSPGKEDTMTNTPIVVAEIIGFGVFVWLGLYLLVRTTRRSRLIVVGLIGLFAQAVFFLAAALSDTASDPALLAWLERGFWWATVLPAAAWFHFSLLVSHPLRARSILLAGIVYAAAGLLILVGTLSDAFVDYASIARTPDGGLDLAPGAYYSLYVLYVALTGFGALANLVHAARRGAIAGPGEHALRQALRVLAAGALLFVVGALLLAFEWQWRLGLPVLPGYLALLAGMAALGYGIVTSGLLLENQQIRRDFLYSFTGLVLLNLLYVAPLMLAGATSTVALLLVVGLVTLTHTTLDQARTLLDRLFFTPAEQEARAEARDYAALLSTTPVTLDSAAAETDGAQTTSPTDRQGAPAVDAAHTPPKEFAAIVRRALTGLKSPPKLAQSPLLTLRLVTRRLEQAGLEDNRLNRAALLREIVIEAVEGLRPDAGGQQASHHVGDAWRFYNVLHYPYVREMSRKGALAEARRLEQERRRAGKPAPGELEQVLAWLADVDEDTYYKWQRRASDTIALILWEAEGRLKAEG
jgi:hypothetical protein